MKKQEIQSRLTENHKLFADYILSLNQEDFLISFQGKWSAGQQLDHIYKAVSPLSWGLKIPKMILRLLLGTANGISRSYDVLVSDYKELLANGAKAPIFFTPGYIQFKERDKLIQNLLGSINKINKVLDMYTEKELDDVRVPHALMGKLTIREMMYFTIYHVNHHKEKTQLNLELAIY